ncbi:Acetoin utilization deacetylase AcuC [Seinonella peptonophila]|uniref:Acetoin utilization deacetylase AcuC n=1 Tax=Seinonella peptonophila TaxID=112248 RepID=A0A1M5BNZ3_9BACL|nr:class II histone deacetylase [Seinonella peptonophila]SHF43957.1 Acetoin utilization deacetylase AcuC [Seinonella peptonophila]
MSNKTGFICDESYFWHDTGNGALFLRSGGWVESDVHSENPATKRRVKNLLERTGFIQQLITISPRMATREEIEYNHGPAYIDQVKKLSDQMGGDAGAAAIVGTGSYEIALLSAGGALTGLDDVMKGQVDNVYVLSRPPGHHAEKDLGMGFCLFNNVAIAAHYARKKYGLKRILIIDWDVHHGNGIESAFLNDPEVCYISLHQEFSFPPDRGQAEVIGEGEGKGYNINIPLPAGTGNAGYLHALNHVAVPIAEQFQPELILIAAGQDPSAFDPLARMMVTAEGFRKMTALVKQMAEQLCQGRLVVCHEGGYSAAYVPVCTMRVIEELSGQKSQMVEDPFQLGIEALPTEVLLAHQEEAVKRVQQIHADYWKFD